ncbi:polyketide cyclase [Agrobacterium tumefaciens]|uniref:Polyketide cyclase n=1 Tax=Agrobacterium cavarae TaxID=2528239 RepID=A0ABY1YB88_9HYPH|nr:SRPBCC family protein [Agrobacterium cavarae]KQM35009.1 polyketide cyclase [Rhizobium sp. Leaf202]KQN87742.1 polyketide cyclase [Rhizobium sp. Leaf68]KQZ97078.1 polyketide cyclase [Rhizobium sp. Root564]MQB20663.1 polyketide cyclase [Agrobacterium tumefaciens]TBN15987.1 polyketide cyclase [Agrobacterium cavarae]
MSSETARHELVLMREIDAPREKIFRAWTDPELLKQWFCPKPWGVSHAELDVRTGGSSVIVMTGPNGEVVDNRGVYLEVVPNEKIVFTDAFKTAWIPSEKPFMTGIVLLEPLGDGKTKYTAMARHWTEEDKKTHEAMGFHEGWGAATDQLAALVATI